MPKAQVEMVIFHHRCAAHVLNLIVQEGLKVSCEAIDAIRESVKFVRCSLQDEVLSTSSDFM